VLVTIDLFSHWYHMHATLISAQSTHKGSPNWVVRLYYCKPVLFTICAMTELWYVSLYAMHFAPDWRPLWNPLALVQVPGLLAMPSQVPAWTFACYGSTPFFLFKQVTNIAQFVEACKVLVRLDAQQKEEEAARRKQ